MTQQIYTGDCRKVLDLLVEDESVNCCVTSPPYFGLRDYGHEGQIGLEETPEEYVDRLVAVFREVRRVLRDDGTLWLNLGDSYAGNGGLSVQSGKEFEGRARGRQTLCRSSRVAPTGGLKTKDLVGIPWRVAFALQADGAADWKAVQTLQRVMDSLREEYGDESIPDRVLENLESLNAEWRQAKGDSWYLRQDIIWNKPNPMPESVRDRCTKAHEYIFLLSKSPKYYFDAAAIAEPLASSSIARLSQPNLENQAGSDRVPGKTNGRMKAVYTKSYTGKATKDYAAGGAQDASATKARIVEKILSGELTTRNKRSVWTVTTKPFKGAHFATFPPDLIEPCILAGSPPGGTVLDPFGGAGTTGMVAERLGRNSVSIELNPQYVELAQRRWAA